MVFSMNKGKMRIKVVRAKEDALSDSEIEELEQACNGEKDEFVVWTPIYSGLRVGELAHMSRDWLNWKDMTINIPPSQDCWCWDCRHYRKGLWQPKTKAGIRSVLIQASLVPILRAHFEAYRKARQVSRQAIEHRLSLIVKRTSISHRVYPHCLRATCATIWASKGMSSPSLQYLMGWENLEAAEHYVQSSRRRAIKEAVEIFG